MTAATAFTPAGVAKFIPNLGLKKSTAHRLALALVWLTIAISSIVFNEPAPVDALTIGLMILLPLVGLVDGRPMLWAGFAAAFTMTALGAVAAALARDADLATSHMTVTFYLIGAWFLFAAFVAKRPETHTRLILNAYLVAGVIAALCGIAGYLDLFPGAFDLFTRYDRASGPFKDPNVYGPFMVAPLLTALHLWLSRPLSRGIVPLLAAGLLMVGILFSFSRGAWAATAIGVGLYGYFYMLNADRNWSRVKLAALVVGGASVLGLVLVVALQSDAVAGLLEQRAALTQPYDEGPDGRFGGQMKAVGLLIENPLGLGAQIFPHFYHHEEVHNVYLSMFLNAGWIGGLLYLMICGGTLLLGFRHALKKTKTAPLFLIAFSALAGNICEGVLIDSDHWRHFYLLMALVWGMMASRQREARQAHIVADCSPTVLQGLPCVPTSRRAARVFGYGPKAVVLTLSSRRSGKIPAGEADVTRDDVGRGTGRSPRRGRIIAAQR
jgi:O-antigen ligase